MRLTRAIHRLWSAAWERWADWRRERRISDLRACLEIELAAGRYGLAAECRRALRREILLRSPQQRTRLARRGLRP